MSVNGNFDRRVFLQEYDKLIQDIGHLIIQVIRVGSKIDIIDAVGLPRFNRIECQRFYPSGFSNNILIGIDIL